VFTFNSTFEIYWKIGKNIFIFKKEYLINFTSIWNCLFILLDIFLNDLFLVRFFVINISSDIYYMYLFIHNDSFSKVIIKYRDILNINVYDNRKLIQMLD